MKTLSQFRAMLYEMGTDVVFHREEPGTACPCQTPEGFRDPSWHRANPTEPVCNEQGFINPVTTDLPIKGILQPPRLRGNRGAQRPDVLLGEVRADDRIGVFPCQWNDAEIDFSDWSDAGEDYILYDNKRYLVVESAKLADIDGDPAHHWECGLRLIKPDRPS